MNRKKRYNLGQERICPECGGTFTIENIYQKNKVYCDVICRNRSQAKRQFLKKS